MIMVSKTSTEEIIYDNIGKYTDRELAEMLNNWYDYFEDQDQIDTFISENLRVKQNFENSSETWAGW